MDDYELLQAYAHHRDEEAFAALVDRHLRLVYAAALRQLRDPDAAQEAVQAVFLALARKAGQLSRQTVVAGWLLRATRYVAANARRTFQRRQEAERRLMENSATPEAESVWNEIAPRLDEALVALSAPDRDILTLRFFEQKSFPEIGTLLGMSEEGARKRAERALHKLRGRLGKRAQVVSAALLAEALDARALTPLDGELATQLTNACREAVSASGGTAPALVQAALDAFRGEQRRTLALQGAMGLAVLTGLAILGSLLGPAIASRWGASATASAGTSAGGRAAVRAQESRPAGIGRGETHGLLFQVVDAQTREPLEAAQLLVTSRSGLTVSNEARTDVSGQARLSFSLRPASDWECRVEIVRDGYVPKFVSWSEAQNDTVDALPAAYTATLDRGASIGGVVTDDRGQAIAGARVVLNLVVGSTPGNTLDRERLTLGRAYHQEFTDTNGRWRCTHAPPRYGAIHYALYHRDYREAIFVSDAIEAPKDRQIAVGEVGRVPMAALARGDARMPMQAGWVFEGTVVDGSGRPIRGATVVQNLRPAMPEYRASTDGQGRFHMANSPGPRILFALQAEGYASSVQRLDLAIEPAEPRRFVLAKGARLRGRVVDENGAAIADASIVPATNSTGTILDFVPWRGRTDEQGRFDWLSAPVEPWSCSIVAPGHEIAYDVPMPTDGVERTFTLRKKPAAPQAVFSGRVLDARSKQPLREFKVLLELLRREPGNDLDTSTGLRTVANAQDGTFAFRFDRSARRAKMEIQAAGYTPLTIPIDCPVDKDRTFELKLEPAEAVVGTVLTPEGHPAEDATVVLCTDVDHAFLDAPRHFNSDRPGNRASNGRTDAEGRFSCEPRSGIRCVAVAHPSGFVQVDYASGPGGLKVRLQPWGRIEGRLALRNQSVANQTMVLHTVRPPGVGLPPVFARLSSTTDDGGRFAIEGVPPGDYQIAHDRTPPHDSPLGRRSGRTPLSHTQIVTVAPGESARVVLGGAGRTVVGSVIYTGKEQDRNRVWHLDTQVLELRVPDPPGAQTPVRSNYASEDDYNRALDAYHRQTASYWASPAGLAAFRSKRTYVLQLDPAGQFQVDDVPPGSYVCDIRLPGASMNGFLNPIGYLRQEIEVPPGDESEPVDCGLLVVPALPDPKGAGSER